MKNRTIIGTLLLFSLSLSSCASLMNLSEFDINGDIITKTELREYVGEYNEFISNNTYEIKDKWYSISYKEKNTMINDDYTIEESESISGSLYYSRFSFDNKMKLKIKNKEIVKGIDPITEKEINTKITTVYDIVYLKGVTYIKTKITQDSEKGNSKETEYSKSTSRTFNDNLQRYLNLNSLDIDYYFDSLLSVSKNTYTVYQLDNGIGYTVEDSNKYHDSLSKFYFETISESYQVKKIKNYYYLNGRLTTDDKNVERTMESLLVIKPKLFGSVNKPSNLVKY